MMFMGSGGLHPLFSQNYVCMQEFKYISKQHSRRDNHVSAMQISNDRKPERECDIIIIFLIPI